MEPVTIVILDTIRSAHNVGAIFRTADGAGVTHIYLGGYTPAPRDRFGRPQPEIIKTSLGATESVAWEQVSVGGERELAARLKYEGYQLVVVEQTPRSISLYNFTPPKKVAYIFGNEIDGVGEEWLALADTVIEIPMRGVKESLNVATTVGIVLFQPLRQR